MAHRPRHQRRPLAALAASIGALVLGALSVGPAAATADDAGANLAAVPAAAAVAGGAAPLQVAGTPQAAVAPPQVAAPGSAKKGKRTVVVDPATDAPAEAAAITVRGSGFDPDDSLWVAICQDDSDAPQTLDTCLGGPIPDGNATTAWGVVTDDQDGAPAGPVVAGWDGDGFELTLQVPGAADQQVDCVANDCSVYVRSAGDSRGQDVAVPMAFAGAPEPTADPTTSAPTTSGRPTTSGQPTTSEQPTTSQQATTSEQPTTSEEPTSSEPTTTEPVPTTVGFDRLEAAQVRAGDTQSITFSGFTAGEPVTATVGGDPVLPLPDTVAADDGTVTVAWAVPPDQPAGTYTLRVEGHESLRVGEATFTVVAAPATSSSVASSSAAPTSSAVLVPPTTSSVETTSNEPTTSSVVSSSETSSAEPSTETAETSESAAPVVSGTDDQGSGTPWWLWITLGVVLLVGLVVGAVVLARRHREETDAEREAREQQLAAAAAEQAGQAPGGQPVPPPGVPGFDEHPDRPILFSHRQAENYEPPTRAISDEQTQLIGEGQTQAIPAQPPSQQPTDAEQGPGTQQFDPFGDDGDAGGAGGAEQGPGTQKFDPFGDDDGDAGGAQQGPGTQKFDPFGDDDGDDRPGDSPTWQPPR